MDVIGAVLLMVTMYIVAPVAVCLAALVALGGAGRLLPGGMRERAIAPRDRHDEPH